MIPKILYFSRSGSSFVDPDAGLESLSEIVSGRWIGQGKLDVDMITRTLECAGIPKDWNAVLELTRLCGPCS